MFKKSAIAVIATLAFSGAASAASANHIGGGAYNLGDDTKFYLTAGVQFTDELSARFDYIDEADFILRGQLEYQYSVDFGGYVGFAHYDYGFSDETGFVAGASYTLKSDAGVTRFFAQHETSYDGFQSLGVRHTYNFNHQWALDLGYRINTDVDNEYNIGFQFKF